jgi:hypothetical protein
MAQQSMILNMLKTPQQVREEQLAKLREQSTAQAKLLASPVSATTALPGLISRYAAGAMAEQATDIEKARRRGLEAGAGLLSVGAGNLGPAQALRSAMFSPEERQAQDVQNIVKGLDMNNPAALKKAAAELSKLNNPQSALMLTERAKKIEADAAASALAEREVKVQEQLAGIKGRQATTQEGELTLEQEKTKLATSLGVTMDVLDNATVDSVAKAANILEQPLRGPETLENRIARARNALKERPASGGTTVTNDLGILGDIWRQTFQEAEAKKFGGMTAEAFTEMEKSVTLIPSALRDVNQMNESLNTYIASGGQTGSFANFRTGMLQGLRGLGVELKDDLLNQTNEGEFINTLSTKYVFPLVKNFPGALAAKELDRLERLGPDAAKQPENIVRLINAVEVDLTQQNYVYNQAVKHLETNDTLQNFRPGKIAIDFQRKYQRLETLQDKHQAYLANPQNAPTLTANEKQEAQQLQAELRIL